MKEFAQAQINALSSFVDSDRFSVGQSSRELHLHDISHHRGILPVTTGEVAEILSWAYFPRNLCTDKTR